jgi:hypothetical protein
MYFYLPNIPDTMYIQYLKEVVLPPVPNIVRICKQITILILQKVTSMLLTPLKGIYLSTEVSNVLVLIVPCKLTNSVLQIYLLLYY